MEDNERELIRTKLTTLVKHTRCTAEFLTFFFERKILTFDEIQEIAGIRVDSEKALEFYMRIKTRTSAFAVLKEGLKKYNQSGALNILEGREDLITEPTLEEIQSRIASLSFEQTTVPHKRNISFDVLPPVISFTGRTRELEQLHQMILRSQGAERIAVVSQVTSVIGLGGIGKTQLAKEYVRLKGNEFDGNVLWMNAESEESLTTSFQRLAEERLNISTKDGNGREMTAKTATVIAKAVYKYFEACKALFVLDNAEKAPWLKQFMPQISKNPTLFVLLTSREREWDRGMEVLQLDGLTEFEAVNLIQQELKIDTNDVVVEDVRKLAQTLQGFPLALQQAIAYIYEQQITLKYSIKDYLQEFKRKQYQLLTFQGIDQLCNESFSATTATTWGITVDKIRNDCKNGWLANFILKVVAYIRADNIKRNLFYLIPSVHTDKQFASCGEEQINEAVRLLVKYSMLNERENQSVLSVHRLVQSVTQNQLAQNGMEETYLEIVIQLLNGSDKNDFPTNNIDHALIVWRHAFKYNKILHDYSWQVEQILWKMKEVGHHEGVRFGNEALGKFKEVFGEDHLNCLRIQRSVGLLLHVQGYFNEAVSVFQEILIKAKSAYGESSKFCLVTKEDLGNSLRQSGKNQESLMILREVLEKMKTIYGDNHSDTLITEENYGLALMDSGNLTEAENVFKRFIKIYINREGVNSTNVLYIQNNLSVNYSRKGNNEKALEIQKEIYEKLSVVWLDNINLFASVCYGLGNLLNTVGKYEEALKLMEGNFDKIKERLGSQQLNVLENQQQIGISYQGLGNYNKALDIFQSVHQGFISLYGEDSWKALNASRNAAISLSHLGEHLQALSKFQKVIFKMEILLGKENCNVIITRLDFVRAIERSAKNLQNALNLLKNAKTSVIRIAGEDAPSIKIIAEDIKRIEKKIDTKKPVFCCLAFIYKFACKYNPLLL